MFGKEDWTERLAQLRNAGKGPIRRRTAQYLRDEDTYDFIDEEEDYAHSILKKEEEGDASKQERDGILSILISETKGSRKELSPELTVVRALGQGIKTAIGGGFLAVSRALRIAGEEWIKNGVTRR